MPPTPTPTQNRASKSCGYLWTKAKDGNDRGRQDKEGFAAVPIRHATQCQRPDKGSRKETGKNAAELAVRQPPFRLKDDGQKGQ